MLLGKWSLKEKKGESDFVRKYLKQDTRYKVYVEIGVSKRVKGVLLRRKRNLNIGKKGESVPLSRIVASNS